MSETQRPPIPTETETPAEVKTRADKAADRIDDLITLLQERYDRTNPNGIAVHFADSELTRSRHDPREWIDDEISVEVVRDGQVVGTMSASRADRENLQGANWHNIRFSDAQTGEAAIASRREDARTGEVAYVYRGPEEGDSAASEADRFVGLVDDLETEVHDKIESNSREVTESWAYAWDDWKR